MKNLFRTISILVMFGGLLFAGYSFWPGSDVKIGFENWVEVDDGQFIFRRSVRIQTANGDWQEKSNYFKPDGSAAGEVTTLGIAGRGVFSFKPSSTELVYLGARPAGYRPTFDSSVAANLEGYAGEGSVAGQQVMIFNQPDGTVIYRAPHLDGLLLKSIGNGERLEAVTVDLGRFRIDDIPNLPVSYRSFENKIAAMETVNAIEAGRLKLELPTKSH